MGAHDRDYSRNSFLICGRRRGGRFDGLLDCDIGSYTGTYLLSRSKETQPPLGIHPESKDYDTIGTSGCLFSLKLLGFVQCVGYAGFSRVFCSYHYHIYCCVRSNRDRSAIQVH